MTLKSPHRYNHTDYDNNIIFNYIHNIEMKSTIAFTVIVGKFLHH